MDDLSICKEFLSIFNYDFSRNEGRCWDEFFRLHLLRDSSEIKNSITSLIPNGRFFSLYRLLSLNFVPASFIETDSRTLIKPFNLDKHLKKQALDIFSQFLQETPLQK